MSKTRTTHPAQPGLCRLALFAGFCPTIKAGFRRRDARRAWGLEVQQRDRRAHDRAIERGQLLLVGEEQREAQELAGEPRQATARAVEEQ